MDKRADTPYDDALSDDALSRAKFLKLMGTGAAVLAGAATGSGAAFAGGLGPAKAAPFVKGGTLNLYTWPNYIVDYSIGAFEKVTGTKVNAVSYDSSEDAFAKLSLGGSSQFDLMIVSNPFVPEMAAKGLFRKLDKGRIPFGNIDSRFLRKNFDPKNTYTIPRAYGTGGIIYDPSAVSPAPKSWSDFFTLGAQPGISGKVEISRSPYEIFGRAFWALGIDWNTSNPADVMRAADFLKKFAPHILAFRGFDVDGYANGSAVLAATTQDAARLAIQQNPGLKFVYPLPTSELWIDSYAILKGPNLAQAYSFINFSLQPLRQINETAAIGLPGPLPNLSAKLRPGVKRKDLIFIPPKVFDRLTAYVVHPKIQALMAEQFVQIQAAAGG